MRYFDAHTHTNFVAYDEDRDAVIERAREAGVAMNVVGTQFDTSKSAVELAEKYDNVYATIGLHPIHTSKSYHDEKELGGGGKDFTSRGEVFDMAAYEAMGSSPSVIAVGECGLDYFRLEEKTKKVQSEAFVQQIELANKLEKPLMLHIRPALQSLGDGGNSYEDALEIIKAHAKVKGDVHFFAGDWGMAKRFLEFGFALSFTGVITFTHDYDDVVRNAPLNMLLSETDAPYVTPVPYRGKRNEPAYVTEVVRAIAKIRGEDNEAVAVQLMENARRVFSLSAH
ncbi:MAG: Hydrolase, TatD family [Candidatus Adlerbacteria bacterium GW2011_GWC1_50_9]|uniref:Hydrolase, TatD family n=1 Tax=Candidatus Adlerbacteria bacterium GW2011_GWC1_50_9 TaxID=1618608 RepID=A0A0G1ZNE9_9BACT|nr:MAG: Hydrolase, TatD family [Candidatus Adlerbacteria bacterium GW2011_GWC1_50_9]